MKTKVLCCKFSEREFCQRHTEYTTSGCCACKACRRKHDQPLEGTSGCTISKKVKINMRCAFEPNIQTHLSRAIKKMIYEYPNKTKKV